MFSLCFPCVFLVFSLCFSRVFLVFFLCFSCVFSCKFSVFLVFFLCFSRGFMVFVVFVVAFLWFSCGFRLNFLCFSSGAFLVLFCLREQIKHGFLCVWLHNPNCMPEIFPPLPRQRHRRAAPLAGALPLDVQAHV